MTRSHGPSQGPLATTSVTRRQASLRGHDQQDKLKLFPRARHDFKTALLAEHVECIHGTWERHSWPTMWTGSTGPGNGTPGLDMWTGSTGPGNGTPGRQCGLDPRDLETALLTKIRELDLRDLGTVLLVLTCGLDPRNLGTALLAEIRELDPRDLGTVLLAEIRELDIQQWPAGLSQRRA